MRRLYFHFEVHLRLFPSISLHFFCAYHIYSLIRPPLISPHWIFVTGQLIISIILIQSAFIRPVLKLSSFFSWYSDNVGRQVTYILPELISRQMSRLISDGRNSWYASGFVGVNLPDRDVFFTNFTQCGPGATNIFMLKDFFVSKIIFAELAVDWPSSTTGLMNLPLFLGKRQ
jgi:hypothetical protein